ncbi:MAG: T9SS type A sorting domain-containing protein [Ignavibacteriaceae bacterium]
MKKINFILFLLLFLIITNKIAANPIAVYWINEFGIDSTGWKIELHCSHISDDYISLNRWFITSSTDTAYFKDGKTFNPIEYTSFDNNDMKTDLKINSMGDTITLFDSSSNYIDRLVFGDSISYYSIASPKPGGAENDTLGIKGYVDGYVKDLSGNPIIDTKVFYSYNEISPYQIDSIYVLTDSSGYFKFRDYARVREIQFNKDNYNDSSKLIQIWPDSTVTMEDIKLVTGIVEKVPVNIVKEFDLSQNFPNPFNNSTSFLYTLPKGDNVEITIYDEKGAIVQKLFSGYQSAGKYRVNWKADNLASGVYIYHVRTGSFKISKKAVLLK